MQAFPPINPALAEYARSILADVRASLTRVIKDRAALATIILIILPWWSLIWLRNNFDWLWECGEIAAIILAYWWLSRSGAMPSVTVKYPRAETLFAIVLTILWAVWRVGICGNILPFLPNNFSCFKNVEFEIAPKIAEQVVLPIVVLFILGYRWRAMGIDLNWRSWWIGMFAVLGVAGYAIYLHWNDLSNLGQRLVEYFFAAGLPEEMLFRAVLLTRLQALLKNPAWALYSASVIFGLIHLPINYLVFTQNDWRETWITALTFQMGMGAVFCFAYQRTQNIWNLAIVHALIDAIRI